MSSIVINIKGRDWTFGLLPDKRFDKLYNPDGIANVAMTVYTTYTVHFRKSDWDAVAIKHELLHVLFNMSLTGSADLTPGDVEEICAEIVGHHTEEIILWTSRITERFLGRE
jgi:hypothetical protein